MTTLAHVKLPTAFIPAHPHGVEVHIQYSPMVTRQPSDAASPAVSDRGSSHRLRGQEMAPAVADGRSGISFSNLQPRPQTAVIPPGTGLPDQRPVADGLNRNLCPICRRVMRMFALSSRVAETATVSYADVRMAQTYRDSCCHTDAERFAAFNQKLATLTRTETALRTAIWMELEVIKNFHGGYKPTWLGE